MPRVTSSQQGGLDVQPLTDNERELLSVALDRSFEDTRTEGGHLIRNKLRNDYMGTKQSMGAIDYAAGVARAELKKKFGGTFPDSDNRFAMTRLEPAYFGFDSWDNAFANNGGSNSLTAGSTANWIHETQYIDQSGNQMGGNAGSALTIGNDAVHLILGIGTHAQSPKISRVKFTLNDVPKTVYPVDTAFRNTDVGMYWLDNPVLLSGEDEFLAEVFSPFDGTDVPYLHGVSFLNNREARNLDPSNLRTTGSTDTETVVSL